MEKTDPTKDFEDDYNFHRRNIRIHSIATPENRHGTSFALFCFFLFLFVMFVLLCFMFCVCFESKNGFKIIFCGHWTWSVSFQFIPDHY